MTTRQLLLLTFACAALAACEAPTAEWSQTEAPKNLRVDYQRLTHPTGFAGNTAQLAGGERERLNAFLTTAQVTADDRVYLEAPASSRLSESRIITLSRDFSRAGYTVSTLPPAGDAIPPNHLLVVVERYVVTPPDCPNWTRSPSGDHENTTMGNFGCSNMTNLGLMVADPRDLVIGRPLGPQDADAASLAIQRYREGKTAPLSGVTAASTYTIAPLAPGGAGGGATSGSGL